MAYLFNELRTRFVCPDCGEHVPLALAIFGLDVRMLMRESAEEFERHVLRRPDRHPRYAFPV